MATLKREGTMIGPMDVLIGAIAMTLPDCDLITNDADLSRISGLTIENWRDQAKLA